MARPLGLDVDALSEASTDVYARRGMDINSYERLAFDRQEID